MRVYIYLFISIILGFSACKQTEDGEVQPPIPTKEMGILIMELQYAEQYSIGLHSDSTLRIEQPNERNYDTLAYFYQEILEKYNIDFPKFVEYLDWYKAHAHFLDTALNYALENLEEHFLERPEESDDINEDFKRRDQIFRENKEMRVAPGLEMMDSPEEPNTQEILKQAEEEL